MSNSYDGQIKYYTLDCDSCQYRRDECCVWGKAIKKLARTRVNGKPLRHCEYCHRSPVVGSASRYNEYLVKRPRGGYGRVTRSSEQLSFY